MFQLRDKGYRMTDRHLVKFSPEQFFPELLRKELLLGRIDPGSTDSNSGFPVPKK
jgi:hypothetical protein